MRLMYASKGMNGLWYWQNLIRLFGKLLVEYGKLVESTESTPLCGTLVLWCQTIDGSS